MKCVIIDDEPLARQGIERLILKMPELSLLESFGNVAHATEYIRQNQIDLVFLDIELSGDNGIQFARSLPEKVMVIFITAYSQYAVDSYEIDAIDYLLKPLSFERFEKAVTRAVQHNRLLQTTKNTVQSVGDNYVVVRSERRFHKLLFDDILFISGLKDYVIVQTKTERLLTNLNLKTMHGKLPAKKFVRVSKSYVVNLDIITSFDTTTIFILEHEVPIGKNYQKEFMDLFL